MNIDPLYWIWKSELPKSLCETIINESKKYELIKGKVRDNDTLDVKVRDSDVTFIDNSPWINAICMHYMNRANQQAWNFIIDGQQIPQFTSYNKDQFYDFHQDSSEYVDGMRKLSLVILLSDSSEYEGGAFKFKNVTPEFSTQGSVIVFPSFITHMVEPVTKGTRYSLVNWFYGPRYR